MVTSSKSAWFVVKNLSQVLHNKLKYTYTNAILEFLPNSS